MPTPTPPREHAAETDGAGGHGMNWIPRDSQLSDAVAKAEEVLSGSANFTFDEMQTLLARIIVYGR